MATRNRNGFSRDRLFDSQTVEENVMFPLKMFTNKSQKEMLARVNFVLDRVNLSQFKQNIQQNFREECKKELP